jgi:hypothetical protein
MESTARSGVTNSTQTATSDLVTNYKKLLSDIRGVIKDQRDNILKNKNYFRMANAMSSDSDD